VEIQIQNPLRFLDVLGQADEQDNLESLFSSLKELEDLCGESMLSSPRCHLYDDVRGFGFAIELVTAGSPDQETWMKGVIEYDPSENRWSVATQ
jgi:hypothetical protein